jgi:hypothetical protein
MMVVVERRLATKANYPAGTQSINQDLNREDPHKEFVVSA